MANKVVNATQLDADLLSIADAIRNKGGTSAALLFPDEFVTAINDIHGGGDAYAAISVTYPAGSVCTCSQTGQDTLTAEDTSGAWLFVVPVGGTWRVESQDTTTGDHAYIDVYIATEYQVESVELLYRLYLYRNGNQCVEVTGGWAIYNSQAVLNDDNIYCKQNGSGAYNYGNAHTSNMIDLTDFSTLNFKIRASNVQNSENYRCVVGASTQTNVKHNDTTKYVGYVVIPNNTDEHILTIDVSAITGSYYIIATNGYMNGQYVHEVWCE